MRLAASGGWPCVWGACALVAMGLGLAAEAPADVGSLAEGTLVGWGVNNNGECNVPSGYFVQISAGGLHGLALRLDGNVAAWGANLDGQCNVPAGKYSQVSAANGGSFTLALRLDGNVAAWGDDANGQCRPPAGSFSQVSAGGLHGLALKSSGALAAWGYNGFGECNVPAGTSYTQVAAGLFHSLALRSDGNIAAWGMNLHGECNVPVGNYTQVAAGFYSSLALRSNGSLAAWGDNGDGECNVPAGTNFTQVDAGALHGLALRSDGNVAAWGYNGYGECNVPAGFYLAVSGGWGWSLGLKARTAYQDLLVSGTGSSALVNRSISVSGNLTVQSTMGMANNPTIALGGKLRIQSTGTANLQGGSLASTPDANLGVSVENDGLLRVMAGAFTVGPVTALDSNLRRGSVQVDAGATLSVMRLKQDAASVAGTLKIRGGGSGGRTTSDLNALSIAGSADHWTGTVDIGSNYLVARNGNLATITNQIKSGLNLAQGGHWDGNGITSSAAAKDNRTAIGSAMASQLGVTTFGEANNLSGSAVLVRYTWWGDCNLDGVVDIENDFFWWSNGYLGGGTRWLYGDFNYDGVVDIENDFFWWSNGYLSQSIPLPTAPGNTPESGDLPSLVAEAGLGAAPGAAPEPGTLTLLALGGLGVLRLRRGRDVCSGGPGAGPRANRKQARPGGNGVHDEPASASPHRPLAA